MNTHDESKIHLVRSVGRSQSTMTRIDFGSLIADILRGTKTDGPLYQWVVQRRGSVEVLGLGQTCNFNDAKAQATALMSELLRSNQTAQSGD